MGSTVGYFPGPRSENIQWLEIHASLDNRFPKMGTFCSLCILKESRVVFNICGNRFRLVVKINYLYSVVYVRFAGTHREYDAVNAQEI